MTWQLYLAEYEGDHEHDEENFVPYRSLNGRIIHNYPLLSKEILLAGRHPISIPNSHAHLSLEVFEASYLIHLNECTHHPPNSEVIISLGEDLHDLHDWLKRGIIGVQVAPRIDKNFDGTEVVVQVRTLSDSEEKYYYLEWWDTDFGPFPEPLPESS